MNTYLFSFFFIPILGIILLLVNLILAPHNPYKEKKTPFECGYHSFLEQTRKQFSISFYLFALMFMVFDLEVVLMFPYVASNSNVGIYGLWALMIFGIILTIGFVFELGKKALYIDTKEEKLIVQNKVIKWK